MTYLLGISHTDSFPKNTIELNHKAQTLKSMGGVIEDLKQAHRWSN